MNIERDFAAGGRTMDREFQNMIKSGKLRPIKGSIDRFTETGILLGDGRALEADLVIFGTGYVKSYSIFDREQQEALGIEEDGLYLYRQIVHPNIPELAFIGSEISTFSNLLTQGLQVAWLERLLQGRMELPSQEEMVRVVEREKSWKRATMSNSRARASIWQFHMMKYHDMLVRDMGERPFRKCCCYPTCAPYTVRDYDQFFR